MTAAGIEVAKVRPDLQAQIDLGGGEDQGDQDAEQHPSDGELRTGSRGGVGRHEGSQNS
jgi:hypothetical protein